MSASTTPAATDALSDSTGLPSGSTGSRRSSRGPDATGPCPRSRPRRPPDRCRRTRRAWCLHRRRDRRHCTPCDCPVLERAGEVGGARDGQSCCGTRTGAPGHGGHRRAIRRCGMTTPCPPNAATERMTAPRLRGSVMLSSATSSGGSGVLARRGDQVVGMRVAVRRHLQTRRPGAGRWRAAGRDRRAAPRGSRCRRRRPAARTSLSRSSLSAADRDVQSGRGNTGTQALDDGVAPEHDLGTVRGLAARRTADRGPGSALGRASRRARGPLGCGVLGARLGGRCRAARLRDHGGAGRRNRRPAPSWCRPYGLRRACSSCLPLLLSCLQRPLGSVGRIGHFDTRL